VKSQRRSTE